MAPPFYLMTIAGGDSIHLTPVRVHPGIVRAGDAEDSRVDGATSLLPHVELPAGPAQGLLAPVAINDGGVFAANPAYLRSIGQKHL